MAQGHMNALIIGHSFTRRLRDWAALNHLSTLNIDTQRVSTIWHGIGGATISDKHLRKSLWHELPLVADVSADIVILEIGSNDLCNTTITPAQLANSIIAFCMQCLQRGARYICVSELLPRAGLESYNDRVKLTNALLKTTLNASERIHFWQHSGRNFAHRFLTEFIASDGVHIKVPSGMRHYFRSIRGAVLYAESRLSKQ